MIKAAHGTALGTVGHNVNRVNAVAQLTAAWRTRCLITRTVAASHYTSIGSISSEVINDTDMAQLAAAWRAASSVVASQPAAA